MALRQQRRWCPHCERYVLATSERANHLAHAAISLFLWPWLIVWWIAACRATPWWCPTCLSPTLDDSERVSDEDRGRRADRIALIVVALIALAIIAAVISDSR